MITELNNKLSNSSTLLTNTAVAWTAGASADAYHLMLTGTEALEIRTPTAFDLAMSIQGTLGGLEHEGTARFYKKVIMPNLELEESLKLTKSAPNGGNVSIVTTNTG